MTISTDFSVQSATHAYLDRASQDFTADPRTNLAVALIEYANESRQDARELRLAEEQHLRALEARQVAALRSLADHVRAQGLAEGLSSIVGGSLTALGGVVQVGSAARGAVAEAASTSTESVETSGIDWSKVLTGAGQVAPGAGKLIGSRHESLADDARADQTAFGHRADASERRRHALDEQIQESLDLQRSGVEHLRNISDAEADAARAVVFRG